MARLKSTTYLLSEYVVLPGEDSVERIDQVVETTKTILSFEGSDQRDTGEDQPAGFVPLDHAHPRSRWFSPNSVEEATHLATTCDRGGSQIVMWERLQNYLYADDTSGRSMRTV